MCTFYKKVAKIFVFLKKNAYLCTLKRDNQIVNDKINTH